MRMIGANSAGRVAPGFQKPQPGQLFLGRFLEKAAPTSTARYLVDLLEDLVIRDYMCARHQPHSLPGGFILSPLPSPALRHGGRGRSRLQDRIQDPSQLREVRVPSDPLHRRLRSPSASLACPGGATRPGPPWRRTPSRPLYLSKGRQAGRAHRFGPNSVGPRITAVGF